MICLSTPYNFKFFKGFLPQISLGSFLNILSRSAQHIPVETNKSKIHWLLKDKDSRYLVEIHLKKFLII